ncbi:hypothetical protein V8C86DRAFT_1473237 [Haematococcus lacustris]
MSLLQAAARAAGPPPSVQPCPECRTNALVQPKPSCCPRQDDPFHWLRDDSHSDPKILEYLRSESQYARAVLGHSNLSALAQALRRDMAGRVPLHEAGPPWQASAALTVDEAAADVGPGSGSESAAGPLSQPQPSAQCCCQSDSLRGEPGPRHTWSHLVTPGHTWSHPGAPRRTQQGGAAAGGVS